MVARVRGQRDSFAKQLQICNRSLTSERVGEFHADLRAGANRGGQHAIVRKDVCPEAFFYDDTGKAHWHLPRFNDDWSVTRGRATAEWEIRTCVAQVNGPVTALRVLKPLESG